ncbi:GT4 family glycosyltransferase PelF [Deinococcus xianganensis]|uniref:DUF3492 domain-containing protein n=1 Tax=Deinococcus xianganensis TaxID=1507289 RepID=A0A6I4YQ27_9DEIO|nr:GT4 family glycosyltransferase PelF [Deinococcus xianganensis]MXV19635.1 DUF3492 domain-containing protein [Deinococcus xianganensis]
MHVALLCEGTYPHAGGGVSVWCDQLIRGLPEHRFQVYALTAQHEVTPGNLPENVQRLESVPLWSLQPLPRRARTGAGHADRRDALDGFAQLMYALFTPGSDPEVMLGGLRRLHTYAQAAELEALLTGRGRAEQIYDLWSRAAQPTRSQQRPEGDLLLQPTLADAVQATLWLSRFLRPLSVRPPAADLTHATGNGLSTLLAFTAKWAYGTPFVLTEHGIYLRERYLELRFTSHSPAFKSFLLRFYGCLTRAAYRMADLITPGSRYNERWEVREGADPARIMAVYNGVNPAAFPPSAAEPAQPTISWVGRIDPLKDLETLIRAFALVREELPGAQLRMFGSVPRGNEDYARFCRLLTQEVGVQGSATFEGHVPAVVDAYHAGHMVALTSISEGFPYTLIEAMATGRATVSTDVGGVSEAVGEAGLVVPSRDPHAVARACVQLLSSAPLRERLGRAARQRVLSQFTLDSFLDVYRGLYPQVARPARVPA